jgi:hypothetical protein
MALREYAGGAKRTTLAAAITAASTTITVTDATGYPTGATGPFAIALDVGLAGEEKVLIASRSGNTLTVASGGRGYDNTSAAAHASATVDHVITAVDVREANGHVNDTTGDPHPQYLTATEGNAAYVAKPDQVWQRIGEAVLAANGSIVFAAIPANFKHLALEVTGRGVAASVVDNLVMRFNNDTRTIYDYQFVGGAASTPTAGEGINASFIELGRVAAATAPAGNVGAFRIEIPDYAATTFHKNVLCSSGYRFADGSGGIHSRQYYGTWRDTSAVSRIDLLGQNAALAAGTIASLYGMKGA